MGPLGWQETIFIFVLALLIFGPKKLPELGKTIGKAMTEFRRASSELRSTWDREMASIERENQQVAEAAQDVQNQIASSTYDYDYNSSYYDSSYDYGYGNESGNAGSNSTDTSTVGATATQGAELTADAGSGSAEPPAAETAVEGTEVAGAIPRESVAHSGAEPQQAAG
jgi:TatA/E family protein of Tat protein translocase